MAFLLYEIITICYFSPWIILLQVKWMLWHYLRSWFLYYLFFYTFSLWFSKTWGIFEWGINLSYTTLYLCDLGYVSYPLSGSQSRKFEVCIKSYKSLISWFLTPGNRNTDCWQNLILDSLLKKYLLYYWRSKRIAHNIQLMQSVTLKQRLVLPFFQKKIYNKIIIVEITYSN